MNCLKQLFTDADTNINLYIDLQNPIYFILSGKRNKKHHLPPEIINLIMSDYYFNAKYIYYDHNEENNLIISLNKMMEDKIILGKYIFNQVINTTFINMNINEDIVKVLIKFCSSSSELSIQNLLQKIYLTFQS